MTSEILKKALDSGSYLTAAKRRIHSFPELGMEEFRTTAFIRSELESMGIPMKPLSGEVGALGIIEGKGPGAGKVIALRADIDALPIRRPGAGTGDIGGVAFKTGSGSIHAGGSDRQGGQTKLLGRQPNLPRFGLQPVNEPHQV